MKIHSAIFNYEEMQGHIEYSSLYDIMRSWSSNRSICKKFMNPTRRILDKNYCPIRVDEKESS
jgi:hypothetical protein